MMLNVICKHTSRWAGIVCGILFLADQPAAAQVFTPIAPVTQYTAPTPDSGPCNLVKGPDGKMWFIEVLASKLARIDDAAGTVQEFAIPNTVTIPPDPQLPVLGHLVLQNLNRTLSALSGSSVALPYPASFACGINNGPDGNIWFTNGVSNLIGYINPTTHQIATFPVPTLASNVEDIYPGPDNAMWFVEPSASKIGRFDLATQQITEYPLSNPLASPIGIYAASDGGLWFPEFVGNKIGRIDPYTKVIVEYNVPTAAALPFVLRAETPGGFLWFSEFSGNKIGRLEIATGHITEYAVPTPASGPVSVTLGSDGNIYSDGGLSNDLIKVDVRTGHVSERLLPIAPGAFPEEIRFGTDDQIWITQLVTNQVLSTPMF